MSHFFFLIYIFLILLGTITVTYTIYKYKRFGYKYLKAYSWYNVILVFSFIYIVISRYINFFIELDTNYPLSKKNVINIGFILFTFVYQIIFTYSFINLIHKLFENRISSFFKYLFIAGIFILSILFSVNIFSFGIKTDIASLYIIQYIMYHVFYALVIVVIIYHFVKTFQIDNSIRKRNLRLFAVTYLILYLEFFIRRYSPISIQEIIFVLSLLIATIAPFFIINLFIRNDSKKRTFEISDVNDISYFYNKYKITKREQEIIKLLLEGKTNEEIENLLFISQNTIRNHIYNIYRKVGVKNRVQLFNSIKSVL